MRIRPYSDRVCYDRSVPVPARPAPARCTLKPLAIFTGWVLLLAACAPQVQAPATSPTLSTQPSLTQLPAATATPTTRPTVTPTPTPAFPEPLLWISGTDLIAQLPGQDPVLQATLLDQGRALDAVQWDQAVWVLSEVGLQGIETARGEPTAVLFFDQSLLSGRLMAGRAGHLWLSLRRSETPVDRSEVILLSTNTGEAHSLVVGDPFWWTPVGIDRQGRGCFVKTGGDSFFTALTCLDPGTGQAEEVPIGHSQADAALSPDGRWAAATGYLWPDDGQAWLTGIWLLDLVSDEAEPVWVDLPRQPSHLIGLSWDRDSRFLYFPLDPGGPNDVPAGLHGLWRLDPEAERIEKVGELPYAWSHPLSLSESGAWLLLRADNQPDRMAMNLESGEVRPLDLPAEAMVVRQVAIPIGTGTADATCQDVETLDPDSPSALPIIAGLLTAWETEERLTGVAVEELWGLTRLGEYAVVQGMFNQSEAGIFVLRQSETDYRLTGTWGGHAILPDQIPNYFTETIPDAPPALFACTDFSSWVDPVTGPPGGWDRPDDYSVVVKVSPDSPEGQAATDWLLADWDAIIPGPPLEYEEIRSIDRAGSYFIVQVRFFDDPPSASVFRQTGDGFESLGNASRLYSGGREVFLAMLAEQIGDRAPDFPWPLLTCLELAEDWFLPQ